MKAEMDERGVITLRPESSIEACALNQWVDGALIETNDLVRMERCYWRGSRLIIAAEIQRSEEDK